MTIDHIRTFCRSLDGTTEDIKWGSDLVFSVGGRMYAVVCLDPPHTLAFKCTPEAFAELVERDGVIPAPYLARAMWVQEQRIGATLERREAEQLITASYELVKAKLPKKVRPKPAVRRSTASPRRGRRAVHASRRKSR